jgi:hypothetical protein
MYGPSLQYSALLHHVPFPRAGFIMRSLSVLVVRPGVGRTPFFADIRLVLRGLLV